MGCAENRSLLKSKPPRPCSSVAAATGERLGASFIALSPLGEGVGRRRPFLQPGRAGPSPAEGLWTLRADSPLRPAGG
jgi:hypothetical protein